MCVTPPPKDKAKAKGSRKGGKPKPPPPEKLLHDKPWVMQGLHGKIMKIREREGLRQDKPVPILLNRESQPAKMNSTEYIYEGKWHALLRFSALVGDYRSCLLLERTLCPDTPPPVQASTMAHCISYFTLEKGTPVTHFRNHAPVLDRLNRPLIACGTWNCPNNVYRFTSALKALHDLYDHLRNEIPYLDVCEICEGLNSHGNSDPPAGQLFIPCRTCHSAYGRARVMRVGNVVSDPTLKKHCVAAHKRMGESHVTKGNVQLLPGEICTLRRTLLTGCESDFAFFENLKVYTMMLVGINLFLRSDEVLSMELKDFQEELTIIRPNYGVRALVVSVKGKTDPAPYSLILWSNDEFTDLCPVRHLLCYLRMAKHTSGYVFPPPGHRATDSTVKYDYQLLLGRMKGLCTSILHREGESREFGTHIFRKTGYLFAIFGYLKRFQGEFDEQGRVTLPKMTMASIMKSARHRAVCNAATYMRDSFSLYHFAIRAEVMQEHDVGVWQDIQIQNASPFTRMLHGCRLFQRPIMSIANWYVESYLSLVCDGQTPFEFILQDACRKDSKGTSHEQLEQFLKSKFSGAELQTVLSMVTGVKAECASLAYMSSEMASGDCKGAKKRSFLDEIVEKEVDSGKLASKPSKIKNFDDEIPMKPPKKSRTYGENDLDYRKSKSWKTFTSGQRLVLLCTAAFEEGHSGLTNGARTFVTNWARPVAKCVLLCHSGSHASFLDSVDNTVRSNCANSAKYRCTTCHASDLPNGRTFPV